MKTKHMTGTTAENDALLLPNGMLSIDAERKAVRFHDGTTAGGYEILGKPALKGPGPQALIGGDMTAGFFGEVTSSELLTYDALASQIGLSAGTSVNNAESLWLKFALEGKILFVAKKPARYNLSWNHINSANAVYENDTSITVGTYTFDVTLIQGVTSNPTADAYGYDIVESHGSEWNRLLYPVHSGIHTDTDNPTTHTDPNADPFGSWAQYSDSDLLVHGDSGNGGNTWCQETTATATIRITRGVMGITRQGRSVSTDAYTNNGWRPVLRFIN